MPPIPQLADRFGLAMISALLPEDYARPDLLSLQPQLQSRRGPVYDATHEIIADFFAKTRIACVDGSYTRNWFFSELPLPPDASFAIVTAEAARMSDSLADMYAWPAIQSMWPEFQYALTALLSYLLVTAGIDGTEALLQQAKLRTAVTLAALLDTSQ
jgi:hypothetical protein